MSTNTTNLGIQKPADGSQTGTWGQTVNTNMDLIDQAVSGVLVKTLTDSGSTGSPNDLPITNYTVSEGRNAYIELTDAGDLGTTVYVQLTPSSAEKILHIKNSLTTQDLVIFQGTYNSARAYTLRNGANALVRFSGSGNSSSTVRDVNSNLDVSALTVAGDRVLTVADEGSGNGLDADTVDGLEASTFQQAATALTTTTTFGGDVTGTYDDLQVTNNSHTHDDRYYTETQVDDFFSGSTPITGYNNTNWDAAYNDKINSVSFNDQTGDLTLTQQDTGTLVTNLDNRYSLTDTNTTDFLLATNADTGFQINAGDEIRFNTSGSATVTQTNNTITIFADVNVNTTDFNVKTAAEGGSQTVNANDTITFAEGGATSISRAGNTFTISSTDTNDNDNDYVDSVGFNSTTGDLTLGRTGSLPDLTQNLDGRYLLIANDANDNDFVSGGSFDDQSGNLTLTGSGGAGAVINLDGRYLQNATADTNDYVNTASFATATGVLTLGRTGSNSLPDVTVNLDGRYLPTSSYVDTNNYVTGASFNPATSGTLTLTRQGLADVTVNLDGRYADNNNYLTGVTFDTATGNLTFNRGGDTTLSNLVENLDGRYLLIANDSDTTNFNIKANAGTSTNISAGETITFQEGGATTISRSGNTITISSTDNNDNNIDYINGASFNSTNGVITLTGIGNASATVDIDGRYALDSITVTGTGGLTGGGDLTTNRTISLSTDQTFATGNDVAVGADTAYCSFQSSIATKQINWVCEATEEMRLTEGGQLDVNGNVVAYSTTVSDERLKDNVETITNPLDTVAALRGVTFEWNKGHRKGQKDIGVIAQEVQRVLPELIVEAKDSLIDGEDYLTVSYGQMAGLFIECFKEIIDRLEALESK